MNRILTLILLLAAAVYKAPAQVSEVDCRKFHDSVPPIMYEEFDVNAPSYHQFLSVLRVCGRFDSVDLAIFQPPIIGTFIIELSQENKQVTYGELLFKINRFKADPLYAKMRNSFMAFLYLKAKDIDLVTFSQDSARLLEINQTPAEIQQFHAFLERKHIKDISYTEALEVFQESLVEETSAIPDSLLFQELVHVDSALLVAQRSHKKALFFFSGFGALQARSMMSGVLADPEVRSYLYRNFSCFIAMTDDHSTGDDGISKRDKYTEMQIKYCNTNVVPYFCIINHQGKVVSEIGYTPNKTEFMRFLRTE